METMEKNLSDRQIIDLIGKLRKREHRQKTGWTIVEGYPEVSCAIQRKVPVKYLFICPELFQDELNEFADQNVTEVSKDVFAKMAFGSRLKGILAICEPHQYQFVDLILPPNPLVVVLDQVEKPGNLGAVLRSADGAGIDAVIACDAKTDIYNQHVVRSSIGNVFTVPTVGADQQDVFQFLKKNNICICVATAKTDQEYTQCDFTQPSAIFVGNEHQGVDPFWVDNADEMLKIPMLGQGPCLNVAVSASILIYEAVRQRRQK